MLPRHLINSDVLGVVGVSSVQFGVGGVSFRLSYHVEQGVSIEPSTVHPANFVPSPQAQTNKLSPGSDRLSPVLSGDSWSVGEHRARCDLKGLSGPFG